MRIRLSNEQGSILLLALVTSGTIGFTLASYLKLVEAQNLAVMRSQTWNSAMPACEAGIEEALTHLNVVGDGDRGVNGWTLVNGECVMERNFGDTHYWVTVSSGDPPVITSTGYAKVPLRTTEVRRAVRVTTTKFGSGMKGMVAKGDINMSGICQIDSFDSEDPSYSSNGRYDSAKRKDNGFVGSVNGSVNGGNGKNYGYVGTGPTGAAAGQVGDLGWVDGNNTGIQPGHYNNDMNQSFPDVQPPFAGGAFTPQSGTVTTTNFSFTSSAITTTTYPSPPPASGVTTNLSNYTSTEYPFAYGGTVTTNTSATSSRTFPAAGTYVGSVVTRTVTSGPPSGRGTWYDYNRITGYTYQTITYTYNTTTTNSTTSTETYNYVLDSENYQLTSLSMSGQAKMLVKGNAVHYVSGDVSITGQGQIIILPGASLKLYVGGASAQLAGNGVMNQNADATKFSYYGLPGNTSVQMTGNAAFTGTIYAPNADFHLGGGGNDVYDCVGATVTETVSMNGHFNFHYDGDLAGRVARHGLTLLTGTKSPGQNFSLWHLTRYFLRSFSTVNQEKNGHSHGQPVCHLFQYYRTLAIRHVTVDLHTPVDRSGMHDHNVRPGESKAGLIQSKEAGILANAGKHRLALPLVLNAQQIDDVGVADGLHHVVSDAASHLFKLTRNQRGGTTESDLGIQFQQGPNVRASHPAIKNITQDRDVKTGNGSLFLANGEQVEQGLGGVFMSAVTRVHDAGIEKARQEMRRPGRAVPDDNDVGIERLQIPGGVL